MFGKFILFVTRQHLYVCIVNKYTYFLLVPTEDSDIEIAYTEDRDRCLVFSKQYNKRMQRMDVLVDFIGETSTTTASGLEESGWMIEIITAKGKLYVYFIFHYKLQSNAGYICFKKTAK